jgi:hypothetical protein
MRGQHPVDDDHGQQQEEGADVEILHLAHALQVHLEDRQRIAPVSPVEDEGRVERDPQGTIGQVEIAEPRPEVRHLVDEDLHDGAEGERHHGQIGAGDAQGGQGQQQAEQGRHHGADHQRGPEPQFQMHQQHPRRIGADAEQGGMADGDLARVAEDDVEAQRHDGEDRDGDQQMQVIGARHHEGADEDRGDGDEREKALWHVRPS